MKYGTKVFHDRLLFYGRNTFYANIFMSEIKKPLPLKLIRASSDSDQLQWQPCSRLPQP